MPIVTSRIATLLLLGGRIAYLRFNIPLEVIPNAPYGIKRGTQLANLLLKTSLIIWVEASMANKFYFEALVIKGYFEFKITR